ncbi:DUF1624 domain-containing protein [Pseudochryseolinea flava]|uniref:Heparan-alpha-glucosaminide N-acetyltransferase catalytic domain-containing protein n=1 Tax=Pseudochryseolinea flava TaxID=2059302 RepID=A0A364Y502_9BACT|nr:heparan-alpha-glucosaminide N-acetyltransferase domain-containing protein [Pseudochryseolinea flava]RAW01268.1 hypothetical protein DQQ10_10175 [Pseudochryseolinea flava]
MNAVLTELQPEQNLDTTSAKQRMRVNAIDMLRGLVMVIMALDHVREFYSTTPFRPEDVSQTSVLLFGTRWITHLCAPTFVFLSGVSAYLSSRHKSPKESKHFLIKRGLWLIFVEIAVISFLFQYGYQLIILEVIWAIGWSMIFLSFLSRLPRKVILAIALTIIIGQHLIPNVPITPATFLPAIFLHTPFTINAGVTILMAYPILPWMAVMLCGFFVGKWFTEDGLSKRLTFTGIVLLIIFIIIRATNVYGDPLEWSTQPRGEVFTFLSFINVNKYPPSMLFISSTLGIALILLGRLDKIKSPIIEKLIVYGKVPLFYFILHLFLISASAYLWSYFQFGHFINFSFVPPDQWPQAYSPSLLRTYLVWFLIVAALYFPCKWYGALKEHNKKWWMSYV